MAFSAVPGLFRSYTSISGLFSISTVVERKAQYILVTVVHLMGGLLHVSDITDRILGYPNVFAAGFGQNVRANKSDRLSS